VEQLVGSLRPGDYLAIHAYLAPSVEVDAAVSAFRKRVTEATGCATTFGYGPRFLHSTGQLHKGGPPKIKVLQLVDRPQVDVPIEALGITFGRLVAAQAAGDRSALEERGRAVTVIDVTETDVAILGSSL
jgi:transaldolase/glucose-6-phosphate isomerase